MAITFACQCGQRFRAKEEHAGKRAKCTRCGRPLTIPAPSHAAAPQNASRSSPSQAAAVDYRAMASLIDQIASHVRISSPGTCRARTGASCLAATEDLGELHRKYPHCPELHYAYAASLQLNLQGETADTVLRECVEAHADFWIAELALRRGGLMTWNPFKCPEFDPEKTVSVHEAVDGILTKALLLSTRLGPLPRAVVFLRDAGDELDVSKLRSCKIEFATIISPIDGPQVVGINGCIYDDPTNPYRTEILKCPFTPDTDIDRFAYELFVRQADYDVVVVDPRGRVKYTRRMTPSRRMQAAHRKLKQMFDTTEGSDIPESVRMEALTRHTAIVDPNTIQY